MSLRFSILRTLPISGYFAVLAVMAGMTGSAQASGAWAPPVKLAEGQPSAPAGLALAPDGTVTTVLHLPLGGPGDKHRLEVRTKPPGGVFGAPVTLSTNSETSVETAHDERGDLAIVWTEKLGDTRVLRGVTRPAGGAFGAPQTISDSGSDSFYFDLDMPKAARPC